MQQHFNTRSPTVPIRVGRALQLVAAAATRLTPTQQIQLLTTFARRSNILFSLYTDRLTGRRSRYALRFDQLWYSNSS